MISITPRAVQEVKRIVVEQSLPDTTGLRVGVVGGGCSGFSYNVNFDDKTTPADKTFDVEGVKVMCDMKSYLYLNGMEIDFQESLTQRGFVFNNPNASKTCGCGSSFSV